MNLARKGLRLDLRTAFREAVEHNITVVRQHLELEGEDARVQLVTLTVQPIVNSPDGEPLLLVLFDDEGVPLSREEVSVRAGARRFGAADHLERELRDTRDRLQSLIEEYETALRN